MTEDLNPSILELQGGYVLHVMAGRPPWCFSIKDKIGADIGHIMFADIEAALQFQRDLAPTPGWQLVPAEPTEEMLEAGDEAAEPSGRRIDGAVIENWSAVYEAMLAAVPQRPPRAGLSCKSPSTPTPSEPRNE